MSPCVTLPQEVLILGAVLGNDANKVVSAVAEDTVTVGILPSATTQDEQSQWVSFHLLPLRMSKMGTQPLVDLPPCSALARSTDLVIHRLVGVKNDTPSGWEGREHILEINGFKGRPVMGSKLYSMGVPTAWDNLWAKALVYKMIAQMLRESWVVGPKA